MRFITLSQVIQEVSMHNFRFSFLLAVMVLLAFLSTSALADSYTKAIEVFQKSPQTQSFFENSYGYAILPTVGKGGIIIGGAYGKGQVYREEKVTGTVSLVKATIGLQLGGQAFSEIIFFQDKRAFDEFTSGDFELDAAASAAVVTSGAQAKAGTEGTTASASAGPATGVQAETQYRKGMAIFVHTKGGLMFEAAVGGQKFNYQAM
ncbi:MAG: hypothetical protein U9R66_03625 [Thermodesulfobacteriota bacterium]|nr:hypothetical protein [Thermodesulfobacteriota bacterium]